MGTYSILYMSFLIKPVKDIPFPSLFYYGILSFIGRHKSIKVMNYQNEKYIVSQIVNKTILLLCDLWMVQYQTELKWTFNM